VGLTSGSPQCGKEKIFLSLPGFKHHSSGAVLVVSNCVYERIHARSGILAAVLIKFQIFSDLRLADW